MSIAAVPSYLGTDFRSASPGLRFGMYLKLWGVDSATGALLWKTHDVNRRATGHDQRMRSFEDVNKTPALTEATRLNPTDKTTMSALRERQKAAAQALDISGQLLRVEAIAVAPFSTGLGNEHPLENGFAFLNPYGLPYLAGSGVKGVLRHAASELADGLFGGTGGWDDAAIESLFGKQSNDHDDEHQRGALSFWDVIPQIPGDALKVEVMTAHQSHYFQKDETPHESGQPNPINFLCVPPGAGFAFHIACNRPFLARIQSDLAVDDRWKTLMQLAIEHAFQWLGFGAKTAVGYGAMREDPAVREHRERELADAEQQRLREQQHAARAAELSELSEADRAIAECLDARPDKNQDEILALIDALKTGLWNGDVKCQVASIIRTRMIDAHKWQEKEKKQDKWHARTVLVKNAVEGG